MDKLQKLAIGHQDALDCTFGYGYTCGVLTSLIMFAITYHRMVFSDLKDLWHLIKLLLKK